MKMKNYIMAIALCLLCGFSFATMNVEATSTATTAIELPNHFDTSPLESWCGVADCDNIIMIGAELASVDKEAGTAILIDENGDLWEVHNDTLSFYDYYLIWIDNHGTESKWDDEVIKIWAEVV